VVEEDNEMKLYWDWVFVWDNQEVSLRKGPARLDLLSATKESWPRQVDCIVLTTDPAYRPHIKERPHNPAWDILESYRRAVPADLEPTSLGARSISPS
jgi:hypothetical protein